MSVQLGKSALKLSSSLTLRVDMLGCTVYAVGGVCVILHSTETVIELPVV